MTEPALFCQLRNVVLTSKMKTNELNLMKKLVWNHIIRVSKYLSNNIIVINTISVDFKRWSKRQWFIFENVLKILRNALINITAISFLWNIKYNSGKTITHKREPAVITTSPIQPKMVFFHLVVLPYLPLHYVINNKL